MTFLFTDIEGSTRLLRQFGPERYAEALAGHRRVLRDAFVAEGGVEVDTQGDAFFVAFPTAAGAAASARVGQWAALANEIQTANLRYRVAGHMVTMGETAAAWPLLEESLRTFRQLGLPRGEAQVLGYLAEKPHGEAISRARSSHLESAAIAAEFGGNGGRAASSPCRRIQRERGDPEPPKVVAPLPRALP